jgi:two-component system sensor histidine kinase KdpD
VIDESERLNRFIANLLDMTKLESGAIVPNTARHDIGEIVGSALRRAGKILVQHKVSLRARRRSADAGARRGAVRAGAVQSAGQRREIRAADTTISIRALRDRIRIAADLDEGGGIPPASWKACSTSSTARKKGDHVRPGTGLGLRFPAVCRGDAWHDLGRQPCRSQRRVLTIRLPIPAVSNALDTAA